MRSSICSQAQIESPAFREWNRRVGYSRLTYKAWEYGFICEALRERGMLRLGKRGLGFAVGSEPLPSLFASFGCEVVATDLDEQEATRLGWTTTWPGSSRSQHARQLADLNADSLCDPDQFARLVRFRVVDANAIPDDLDGFDFCWSTCAFEHFGSITNGRRFISAMLRCLKPEGVAVHTTAINLCSNDATLDDNPGTVLYRQRDLEDMADDARAVGRDLDLDLRLGTGDADTLVSYPPHADPCLSVALGPYVFTAVGLIFEPVGTERPRAGYNVAAEWLKRVRR